MQKTNYWIIGLLLLSISINLFSFFSKKDADVASLKSQNDSLKVEFNKVRTSVEQIDSNLQKQLNKVDSSIASSRKSIAVFDETLRIVRGNLGALRNSDPESYTKSLSREEKEKNKKLIYKDVTW